MKRSALFSAVLLVLLLPGSIAAQNEAFRVARLVPSTDRLTVTLGARTPFSVRALDASGAEVAADLRVSGPRGAVQVGEGFVEGLSQGEYEIVATLVVPAGSGIQAISLTIPVVVTWPEIATVAIEARPGSLFVGTTLWHDVTATHADATFRPDPAVVWTSSDEGIATIDGFGNVRYVSW